MDPMAISWLVAFDFVARFRFCFDWADCRHVVAFGRHFSAFYELTGISRLDLKQDISD